MLMDKAVFRKTSKVTDVSSAGTGNINNVPDWMEFPGGAERRGAVLGGNRVAPPISEPLLGKVNFVHPL